MPQVNAKSRAEKATPAGMKTIVSQPKASTYKYKWTTGPFSLPDDSHSLDWFILNNDSTPQTVRVDIYKLVLDAPKVEMAPAALEVTIQPGASTHNANGYPVGFCYEIQVQANSKKVFPFVDVWRGSVGGTGIPGAQILASQFLVEMP